MSNTTRTLTAHEQDLIARGLAVLHEETGRLFPVIRGGDETEEEKTARLAAEEAARVAAAAAAAATFSQADVDRIVGERLARDRKDRPSDEQIAELQAAKTKLEEIEAANATELEKATKRAETAEAAARDATESVKKTRLESAILAEASKSDRKVVDPQAVLTLLDRTKLELDGDGNPTNIATAMDALLAEKTYLVGSGGNGRGAGGNADQGARGGGENQLTSTEGMTPEEIATAVSEGRFDGYLASKT